LRVAPSEALPQRSRQPADKRSPRDANRGGRDADWRIPRRRRATTSSAVSGVSLGLGVQRDGRFPCGEAWGTTVSSPGFEAFAWSTKHGSHQAVVLINTSGLSENASQALTNLLVTA
jgi:hypothetical protein